MTVHELKTWPNYFEAILDGRKLFELRVNDRDFHVGDELFLCEYIPGKGEYTGRQIRKLVTYILPVTTIATGVTAEQVIMGIKDLPEAPCPTST
jgi:hypothetical protein